MNKISFGVRVPNSGPLSNIENIVNAAKSAEEFGFDAIWVHDHVVWSSEMHRHHISSGAAEALTDTQDANFFEATTILSYLAAETKKIVLGVACLVMPCRNPIYAAKQYSTLDHLANGRLLIGVGLGSKATRESDEFGVFGVPYERRGDRTDEYIEAMKAIWTQPLASYKGDFIQFKGAEVYPKAIPAAPSARLGRRLDEACREARRKIRRRLDTGVAFSEGNESRLRYPSPNRAGQRARSIEDYDRCRKARDHRQDARGGSQSRHADA